jgi:hypothetical protein
MDRRFRTDSAAARAGEPARSEAWLFAQAIRGRPIPDPAAAGRQGRAEREQSEWLAGISTDHEEQLRKLESAEADARRGRKQLEWVASISTEHEHKLRTLLREEAESRGAKEGFERFAEAWNEEDHPRKPKGPEGGQWVAKGGASAGGADGQSTSDGHTSRPTLNSEGVEVAGKGPQTTRSYQEKVQKALEILDPKVARWWKANSVNGQVRSRAAGWWQSKHRSWLEGDTQPVVEVDQNATPGDHRRGWGGVAGRFDWCVLQKIPFCADRRH